MVCLKDLNDRLESWIYWAPLWIAKTVVKFKDRLHLVLVAISQKATETAVNTDPSEVMFMKDIFLNRRNLVLEKLKEIKGINCNIPQGAFYLFPDVSYYFGKSDGTITINSSDDLCMYLLNKCHVSSSRNSFRKSGMC